MTARALDRGLDLGRSSFNKRSRKWKLIVKFPARNYGHRRVQPYFVSRAIWLKAKLLTMGLNIE